MRIENLPFYWRLKERGSKNIVPNFLPFEFDFIESLQLIIQKRDTVTLTHLEDIYKADSNIGYLQDINEIAKPYGIDFLNYINEMLQTFGKNVNSILEVGCGGCTILSQLKNQGYETIGIDPSPIALKDGAKKGINVINEFFPTPKFTEKVDLIMHSDVIEHVSDPVDFLIEQRKQLTQNGLIIISLPDANEGVAKGELSMAIHQHLNYFDFESLKNTLEATGLSVLSIVTAKYGGSLYCCAQNTPKNNFTPFEGKNKIKFFNNKIYKNIKQIGDKIKSLIDDDSKSVGFYVPLRALPYIAAINKFNGFRFFDDTHHWYNRAFDGVEVYVENFNDLKNKPVSDLFIMSLTFGDVIKRKIESQKIGVENILLLKDLLTEK